MNLPFISVIIDTITRDDYGKRPLADDLQATLDGGAFALIAFAGRCILLDWLRLIRNYALTGGLTAVFRFGHATLATPASSR